MAVVLVRPRSSQVNSGVYRLLPGQVHKLLAGLTGTRGSWALERSVRSERASKKGMSEL